MASGNVNILKAHTEHLTALLESADILVSLQDLDGRYTFCSRPAFYGLSMAEVLGGTPEQLFQRDSAERLRTAFSQVLHVHQSLEFELEQAVRGRPLRLFIKLYPVFGSAGTLEAVGSVVRDVTAQRKTEDLLKSQHELGLALSSTSDLHSALQRLLAAALEMDGVDCGGIYLVDESTGDLRLAVHCGLSDNFVRLCSFYAANTPQAVLAHLCKPVYGEFATLSRSDPETQDEGLRALAVIPVLYDNCPVAVFNLASHTCDVISAPARIALNALAAQIGGAVNRVRIENSLRQVQENLQVLFDTVEDFLFIVGMDSRILDVNCAVEQGLGYPRETIVGKNVLEIHPPDRREEARRILEAMLGGDTLYCHVPLLTRDGKTVPVETRVTPGLWHGRPVIIGVSRDTTERDRALEALRVSEERYRGLVNACFDIVWSMNARGEFTFISPSVEKIAGFAPEELIGKSFSSFLNPECVHRAQQTLEDRLAGQLGKDSARSELIHRHKDGREFIGEVRSIPIFGPAGELHQLVGLTRDITASKRAEDALRESEEHYRSVVAEAPVGIFHLNRQGTFINANPSLAGMFGFGSVDGFLAWANAGTEPERLLADPGLGPQMLEEAHQACGAWTTREVEFRKRDGTSLTARVLYRSLEESERIRGAYEGFIEDVTARKKAEADMLRASRIEATATLAGGIAHDFNNLMASVLGYAEILSLDCQDRPDALDMLQRIQKAALRAGELSQMMLAYARGGRYVPQPLCINESVAEALELCGHAFSPETQVEQCLAPDLWNVFADSTQMSQIVMNLFINAAEAITGKGRITIRTQNLAFPEPFEEQTLTIPPGRYVRLTMADTGCGMDRRTLARVFEPFFTTKFHGRGLGLAAVYGIVANHGGHIAVESDPQRGSSFRVYLSALHEVFEQTTVPESPLPTGQGTILLIEDEPDVAATSRLILEHLGYRVLLSADGLQGVNTARSFEGAIDAALLDLRMPRMSGYEAFPLLRQARPAMPIIICSGYDIEPAVQSMLDDGAWGFLRKPVSKDVFRETLCRAVARTGG